MKLFIAVLVVACNAPAPASPSVANEHTRRLTGAVTDMDFGCWSDANCGIKVDDAWIVIEGGIRERVATGTVTGIEMSGAPSEEIKKRMLGRVVEVYAAEEPIFDAAGNVSRWDEKRLTLTGSDRYYVRAK